MMAEATAIEWAHSTFSPWRSCQKVSTECENCYLEALSKRNPSVFGRFGPQGTRVVASEAYWRKPLAWDRKAAASRERLRVFPSLCDPFESWDGPMHDHKGAVLMRSSDGWVLGSESDDPRKRVTMSDVRRRMFDLIDRTPNLDWLLLTKRPENARRMWPTRCHRCDGDPRCDECRGMGMHRRNVQLLASAGTQQTLDRFMGPLLECRPLCPVLGLSVEPLLGRLDLTPWLGGPYWCNTCCRHFGSPGRLNHCPNCGYEDDETSDEMPCPECGEFVEHELTCPDCGTDGGNGGLSHAQCCERDIEASGFVPLTWVIIGCESRGPRVGRLGGFHDEIDWLGGAVDIVRQCRDAGVACFVKQICRNGRVCHDLELFPPELRVREFPAC